MLIQFHWQHMWDNYYPCSLLLIPNLALQLLSVMPLFLQHISVWTQSQEFLSLCLWDGVNLALLFQSPYTIIWMQNSIGYVLVPWHLGWLFHNMMKPLNQSWEAWPLALTLPVTFCGGNFLYPQHPFSYPLHSSIQNFSAMRFGVDLSYLQL